MIVDEEGIKSHIIVSGRINEGLVAERQRVSDGESPEAFPKPKKSLSVDLGKFIQNSFFKAKRMEDASESSPSTRSLALKFFVEKGLFKRKRKIFLLQVFSIRIQVMRDCHDSTCVGH